MSEQDPWTPSKDPVQHTPSDHRFVAWVLVIIALAYIGLIYLMVSVAL